MVLFNTVLFKEDTLSIKEAILDHPNRRFDGDIVLKFLAKRQWCRYLLDGLNYPVCSHQPNVH